MKRYPLQRHARAALLATAALIVSATGAAQAQVIVLQSTVAKFKPGTTLAKSTRVVIPAGGTMLVVLSSGATRTVPGPYNGTVAELAKGGGVSNAALFNAVKNYVKTGGSTTSSVGALRSVVSSKGPAFSWTTIPVKASGDLCLEKGAAISLERGRAGRALELTIVDLDSSRRANVQFGKSETRVAWPGEVPLRNGSFALLKGRRDMKQIRVRLIAPLPGPGETLQVLHGQRCGTQFEAYLRKIKAASN